jgi:hypothetical protein
MADHRQNDSVPDLRRVNIAIDHRKMLLPPVSLGEPHELSPSRFGFLFVTGPQSEFPFESELLIGNFAD